MEEIYKAVSNLGFPIAMCMYLLIRIEGKLQTLTDSLNDLSKAIGNIRS